MRPSSSAQGYIVLPFQMNKQPSNTVFSSCRWWIGVKRHWNTNTHTKGTDGMCTQMYTQREGLTLASNVECLRISFCLNESQCHSASWDNYFQFFLNFGNVFRKSRHFLRVSVSKQDKPQTRFHSYQENEWKFVCSSWNYLSPVAVCLLLNALYLDSMSCELTC